MYLCQALAFPMEDEDRQTDTHTHAMPANHPDRRADIQTVAVGLQLTVASTSRRYQRMDIPNVSISKFEPCYPSLQLVRPQIYISEARPAKLWCRVLALPALACMETMERWKDLSGEHRQAHRRSRTGANIAVRWLAKGNESLLLEEIDRAGDLHSGRYTDDNDSIRIPPTTTTRARMANRAKAARTILGANRPRRAAEMARETGDSSSKGGGNSSNPKSSSPGRARRSRLSVCFSGSLNAVDRRWSCQPRRTRPKRGANPLNAALIRLLGRV